MFSQKQLDDLKAKGFTVANDNGLAINTCDQPTKPKADQPAMRQKAKTGDEKKLQNCVENYLTMKGFRRRNKIDIERDGGFAGWIIHLHRCEKNPYLLDLLVLLPNGRYVEIELKTETGKLTPEQEGIIKRGNAVLCRTIQEVNEAIWRAYQSPAEGPEVET